MLEYRATAQKVLRPSHYPHALEFVIDGVIRKCTAAQD
jgi:hypothetical protein